MTEAINPLDIAGAHKLMDSIIYGNGSAKCAFDIALYDIAGKYSDTLVENVHLSDSLMTLCYKMNHQNNQ